MLRLLLGGWLAFVTAGCGGGGSDDGAPALQAPAGLAYAANPVVYTVGTDIGANAPSNSGGTVESWSVLPALPAGLQLDPSSGVLSGIPEAAAAVGGYVVTATNAAGSSAATLTITVEVSIPSGLTARAGAQRVELTWTPSPGAASYNVYTSTSGSVTTADALVANVTSPAAVHEHVGAGVQSYGVTAVCATGETGISSSASAGVNRIAFVTSAAGSGDLGSWPAAAGATGTAAGDAICQSLASAQGLLGAYRAFLSDATDDAYCRVNTLAGKKAANCGQATLPAAAGPWVRTDGLPFLLELPSLAALTPMMLDEAGQRTGFAYFTASDWQGVASANDCAGWTSTTGQATYGDGRQPVSLWAGASGAACATAFNLLCLETGIGPALTPATGRRVFKTSASGTGDLSSWPSAGGATGLAAGDAICQVQASGAGLAGSYRAWLSDGTSSAADRITGAGPWIRVDGVPVANDRADLFDGGLITAIAVDQTGDASAGIAWTGTTAGGAGVGGNCSGWTDGTAGSQGRMGYVNTTDSSWSDWADQPCGSSAPIYCFED